MVQVGSTVTPMRSVLSAAPEYCSATADDCENDPTTRTRATKRTGVRGTPGADAACGPRLGVSYKTDRVQVVAKWQSGIRRGVSVGRTPRGFDIGRAGTFVSSPPFVVRSRLGYPACPA